MGIKHGFYLFQSEKDRKILNKIALCKQLNLWLCLLDVAMYYSLTQHRTSLFSNPCTLFSHCHSEQSSLRAYCFWHISLPDASI